MKRRYGVLALLLAVAAIASPSVADEGTMAWFEGSWIDLSVDWGEAQACLIGDESVCFRTEAELDDYLGDVGENDLACSGTLRLYDNPSFGLPMVALLPATGWKNLSTVSFDNRTESYRVGGCDARFADLSGGNPPLYPASLTMANMSSATMASGWNNRVSSVVYG